MSNFSVLKFSKWWTNAHFLLFQGYPSQEETLRIVAEYDALRGGPSHATYSHMPSQHTHYGAVYQAGPQSYVQPPNAHVEGYAVNGSLIDLLDEAPRPPPYAPVGQDPHGATIGPPQPHWLTGSRLWWACCHAVYSTKEVDQSLAKAPLKISMAV